MKKKDFKDEMSPDYMIAFFMPMVNLASVGIKYKMKPKEVVKYFFDVVEEFMNGFENIGRNFS